MNIEECTGPCSPSSQRIANLIVPRSSQTSRQTYREPKIGTIDNGFEYQGKNVWKDIETGQQYFCDSQDGIIKEKKKRRSFLEKFFNKFPWEIQ